MKTSTWFLHGFVLVLLLTIPGCKESYTVVTTLLADGSCDRVITVTCDSIGVPDSAFPLYIDSSWETSWKAPARKGEKYLFTARKHFAHMDSLSLEYSRGNDSGKIHISIDVNKEFRWFYTHFTYSERFSTFNPFSLVPVSQFMSGDEIHRYLAGEKSDSLKKKREEWEARSMFEEYYQGLITFARKLNHPGLPVSLIESKKENLYDELMSSSPGDVVNETATALGTPVVRKFSKELNGLVDEIMEKSKNAAKADGDYVSTIVMPGTIVETNAAEVTDNSAVWRYSDDLFSMADFVMRVESRSANVWAMAVTGMAVLALVVIPTALRLRRQRHPGMKKA